MDKLAIKDLIARLADDAINLTHDIDSESNLDTVSERYSIFKRELESISETYRKGQGKDDEKAFLVPAVQEAWLALKVPAGSGPSAKMARCLSDAEDLLSYYHSQL